jgi:NADP-reducing hydrogenase subunit HndB
VSKLSHKDLETIRGQHTKEKSSISIGMSACGLAAGAEEVYKTLVEEVKKRHLSVEINKSGCMGMCYAEPLVEVKVEGLPTVTYGRVTPEVALRIIERHVIGKMLLNDYIFEARL